MPKVLQVSILFNHGNNLKIFILNENHIVKSQLLTNRESVFSSDGAQEVQNYVRPSVIIL